MLKLIDRETDAAGVREELTPQAVIEAELAKVINLGNIECAYLFSGEGLLLAGSQGRSDFNHNQALEIMYSVNDALLFIQNSPGFIAAQEILLVAMNRRKIVVRTFPAFQQQVSLILVIPPAHTYRSHTNRLITKIQKIGQTVMSQA